MTLRLNFVPHALLTGLTFLTLSACSEPLAHNDTEHVQMSHNGAELSVPSQPDNLVVLDLTTLDALTLFDYEPAGVPQTGTRYPDYMERYQSDQYFNAGGYFEPDFERINASQAELIIAGGRARDAAPELSRITHTIDLGLEFGDVVSGIETQLNVLGQISGEEARAAEIFDNFTSRIGSVREKSADAGTAMVVMIVGGRLSAYGTGSRFGFIYDELGFQPAMDLENRGTHGNPMSFELLLRADPDWLFVFSRDQAIGEDGAQSATQVLDNELVHSTSAHQEEQIVILDSSAIYIAGGVNAYLQLIDQVEAALDAAQ